MYQRLQKLVGLGKESCFLWGPRQTGKSTLLKALFPHSTYYDLLLSDQFERFSRRPSLLREELLAKPPSHPVIIDEVQKIPALLDEVQWLSVNRDVQFVLSGSSARKLRRGGGNLLGGRALRYELYPLVSAEISDFDLFRALNNGLIPRHYDSSQAMRLCQSYVGDYLKEEIAAEALTRNIPAFSRFLEVAALSSGEMINFTNVAAECGVSSVTAKEYFQILEDTLIGCFLPSYRLRPKRRVILSPKFYFFDLGIVNFLLKRGSVLPGSEVFGRALEQFIFQEIRAYSHYSGKLFPLAYWRSASGLEIDFVLGDNEVALEVKGSTEVQPHHMKNSHAFAEEYTLRRNLIVSMDQRPRLVNGIEILPVDEFLAQLWKGEII